MDYNTDEYVMDKLYELYYSPKTGLISAQRLYLKLNKEVPISQIIKFLDQQEVHQLHQESQRKPAFSPITVYSVNDQWQVDLIDLSKYSRWNAGYKYLLCAIDVFSRKSFVVAMKKKSNTTDAMRVILDVQKPILIQSDNGTEFLNNNFQSLLQAKGVCHITVNVGDHNIQGLIERFNRTLENIIARYQESRKSNRYIDVLQDIVFNYNNTYHRGVNDIPQQLYLGNQSTGTMNVKITKHSIKVGDRVRILKGKQTFRKGYVSKYSNGIYTVSYKYYELERVEGTETFLIEPRHREPTMTNKERRNKRELQELARVQGPANKKRRTFGATYFLKNYKDYLQCIKNWDAYSSQEQDQLRKWYREYYSHNKEVERKRYKDYYASNAKAERERLKKLLRLVEITISLPVATPSPSASSSNEWKLDGDSLGSYLLWFSR
ncbi:hypothetical protein BDEG_27203 [Batrachochytrium dendrobatidis JEL423]|uniref:Integrase catalytic domain-containing protein n=1 Tax=Batrachochytrium dendrobatidis (strain JEL423) TaxID=403673 RepID=A0A177WWY8_BATDL|nr:hypothetical protein BDEG_27203 [Batrachochytrium dendrobatidis JEL423]